MAVHPISSLANLLDGAPGEATFGRTTFRDSLERGRDRDLTLMGSVNQLKAQQSVNEAELELARMNRRASALQSVFNAAGGTLGGGSGGENRRMAGELFTALAANRPGSLVESMQERNAELAELTRMGGYATIPLTSRSAGAAGAALNLR